MPGAGAHSRDGHSRCLCPGERSSRDQRVAAGARAARPAVAPGLRDARSPTTPARAVSERASPGGRGRPPRAAAGAGSPADRAQASRTRTPPPRGEAAGKGRGLSAASPSAENLPGERATRSFPRRRPQHRPAGRRGSRHSLGPVRPGAGAPRRARAAPPRAGRSPLERLATGQRFWQEAGREPRGRREEERGPGRGGGRDGRPSPALINHPADQMSPPCTREGDVAAHKEAAAPFL